MWSVGTGSEVMKRIAAPMIGGIFTSFLLELLVYPAIYETWKRRHIADSGEPEESSNRDEAKSGEMAVAVS